MTSGHALPSTERSSSKVQGRSSRPARAAAFKRSALARFVEPDATTFEVRFA
jgi:hypothetical protein